MQNHLCFRGPVQPNGIQGGVVIEEQFKLFFATFSFLICEKMKNGKIVMNRTDTDLFQGLFVEDYCEKVFLLKNVNYN